MSSTSSVSPLQFLKNIFLNKQVIIKIKSTGIYLLVPIINFGVSFLTSPLFAKYLSAEEYGYYGYYLTLASFLLVFSSLSLQTYYMSVYFKHDEEKRKVVQTTLIVFTLLWNLVFFPVAYLGIYVYLKISHSHIPFFPFALLALVTSILSICKGFVQVNYRLGNQPIKYLVLISGYRVLGVVVSLYFVMVAHMALEGRMIGVFIVEALFFIISLYTILKGQRIVVDRQIIKLAFRKVLPLLPASFLFWPLMSFDNIVLARLGQPVHLGLYNIGKGIANYLYIALFSFFQAFEPDIYKHAAGYNLKALRKTGLLIIALVVVSIFAFWIFSPYLIKYLTANRFVAALQYSNILAVTYGLIIIYSVLDAIILAWQQTHINLIFNIIGAVTSIIAYTLAAKYFMQTGVAIATVCVHLLLVIMLIIFISKKLTNYNAKEAVLTK